MNSDDLRQMLRDAPVAILCLVALWAVCSLLIVTVG